MKKDRNCSGAMPYPVYPPYQAGMMPMPMPMSSSPFMNPNMGGMGMNSGVSSNTIEEQMNTLEQQINLLDKRITNLENLYNSSNSVNYSTKYNSSNYQMM